MVCAALMGGVLLALGACGAGNRAAKSANQTGQGAPPPVSHTVFAPYINDINKAKQVQHIVNAQKQALDRAIQSQSGTDNTPAPSAQTPR
jgi:hypothetical protein